MNNELITRSKKRETSDSVKALLTLAGIMFIGMLGTQAYAFQTATRTLHLAFASIGLMVAGSSLVIGGLLGFLFGIPRTLQGDEPINGSTDPESPNISHYRANTNLEQSSDWLTKILVGVGLTQITVLPDKLQQLSAVAASGLDSSASSQTFVAAVILYFVVSGFLFGYLWTRLFLPGAFRQADLSMLVNRVEQASKEVEQVNQKLDELEKQTELDANALSIVQRFLNPSPDLPDVSQEALNAAVSAASRPIRIQIFTQAQKIRSENWREKKERMESTIPLFRALIASDKDGQYHRNHSQLAYALKDQRSPDLKAAEAELTKAIEIRGPWRVEGWLFYEFNRAICRILQDEEFQKEKPSTEEPKKLILADLRAAATCELKEYIAKDPNIEKWMLLNEITDDDLEDRLI